MSADRWSHATGFAVVAALCIWNPWGYVAVPSLPTVGAALVGIAVVVRYLARGVLVWHRAATLVALTLAGWFLAALLSPAPALGVFGAMGRSNGAVSIGLRLIAVVAGLSLGRGPATRRSVAEGMMAGSWVLAAIVVLGRLGVGIVPDPGGPRASGPLGSASFTGAAIALLLPLTGVLLIEPAAGSAPRLWRIGAGPTRRRLIAAAAVVVQVVALMATGARAAWIGAAVAAALAARAVIDVAGNQGPRRSTVVAGALAVVAVAMAGFFALGLQDRLSDLTDASGGRAGRVAVWSAGVRAVPSVLLVGAGPDQQQRILPRHLPDDFERYFDDAVITDRAHNEILDSLLAAGLVGTVPLVASWVVVGRAIWRSRADPLTALLGAGLAAHLVHLGFNFAAPQLELLVWVAAGLALGPQARTIEPPLRPLIPAILVGGGVAFPLALDVLADQSLARGVTAEQAGDQQAATAEYNAADGWASWQPLVAEVRARFSLRVGDGAGALEASSKAAARSGRDPHWVELHAQALLSTGQAAQAAQVFESLIADDDHNSSLYEGLGYAYRELGRIDEAREMFFRAQLINPRHTAIADAIKALPPP